MIRELRESKNPFTGGKVIGAGVDNDTYHRQDPDVSRGNPAFVMSRSELMLFSSCPSRWIRGYAPKETNATEWGSLFDCLITDPESFDRRYVLRPETVTATKTMICVRNGEASIGDKVPWRECDEAKEWKRDVAKGREIVTQKEWTEVTQARDRLMEDPLLARFVSCSVKQVMVVTEYHDALTKIVVPWKSLIDFVPMVGDELFSKYLGDLKTCRSAAPWGWDKVCDDLHYDAQAAANLDAYTAATGEDRGSFVHIMVENQFPFEPSGELLSFEFVEFGRLKIIDGLRRYCQCLQAGHWPNWREMAENPIAGFIQAEPRLNHSMLKE